VHQPASKLRPARVDHYRWLLKKHIRDRPRSKNNQGPAPGYLPWPGPSCVERMTRIEVALSGLGISAAGSYHLPYRTSAASGAVRQRPWLSASSRPIGHVASSSRSQVAVPTAGGTVCLTWEPLSVNVRRRPLLMMTIVTHLVTRSLTSPQAGRRPSDKPVAGPLPAAW
jgi:hypothetical protein